MKTKLLALTLLAASSVFAGTRVFIGFGFGDRGYYAPRPAYVWVPAHRYTTYRYTVVPRYYSPYSVRYYVVGPRHHRHWRRGYWGY